MKLAKSLLLGSAAGLAVVSGASAADLPSRKAAPAEYVRVCSAYGAGFFYIPGTDVCLKVGGFARYQMQYASPLTAASSSFGTRSQLRVELDARNPTAYGTLRAFVRLDVAFRTGNERSGSAVRQGYGFDAGAGATTPILAQDSGSVGRAQTQVIVDKAFVQWGGLVAGRTNSLFEYNKSPELIGTLATSGLYPGTNLIGYIATFGSGFYASVSLEDAVQRRQAFSNAGINAAGGIGGNTVLFNGVVVPGPNAAGTVAYYGGFRMPDIVGAIGVDQSWGGAQLSGAVHQIPVNSGSGLADGPFAPITGASLGPLNRDISSKYGWAISAGVMFKLDNFIAPGDYLWMTANYADGAMSYVHSGYFAANLNNQTALNSNSYWGSDAYINPLTGGVSTSKTWSVAGAFQHYWTPTLRSAFFGSYAQFNNPGTIADWDYWNAGANIVWSPIRALDIGIEAAFQHIQGRHVALPPAGTGCNTLNSGACGTVQNVGLKSADGTWTVRFRVQRAF